MFIITSRRHTRSWISNFVMKIFMSSFVNNFVDGTRWGYGNIHECKCKILLDNTRALLYKKFLFNIFDIFYLFWSHFLICIYLRCTFLWHFIYVVDVEWIKAVPYTFKDLPGSVKSIFERKEICIWDFNILVYIIRAKNILQKNYIQKVVARTPLYSKSLNLYYTSSVEEKSDLKEVLLQI